MHSFLPDTADESRLVLCQVEGDKEPSPVSPLSPFAFLISSKLFDRDDQRISVLPV